MTTILRRKGAYGDVLLLTPIIRELLSDDKNKVIVWTDCGQILTGLQTVYGDRIQISSGADYPSADGLIDFDNAYEFRQGRHILDAYSEVAKLPIPVEKRIPQVVSTEADREWVKSNLPKQYIVLDYGQTWSSKTWSIENYNELMRLIEDLFTDCPTVGVGSQPRGELCKAYRNLTGQTSIERLIAVIEGATAVVCNDSLLVHIAQALNKPVVAIFGCTDPRLIIQDLPTTVAVRDEQLDCKGCHHWLPGPRYFTDCILTIGRNACLTHITPRDVYGQLVKLLTDLHVPISINQPKEKVVGKEEEEAAYSESFHVRPYVRQYCVGVGLDIACGPEKVVPEAIGVDYPIQYNIHKDHLTVADVKLPWEMILPIIGNNTLDYVYSSHLIEDYPTVKVQQALSEWIRVLKPGGLLILFQPIENLYKEYCRKTGQVYNNHHQQNWSGADDFLQHFPLPNCDLVESSVTRGVEPLGKYSFYVVLRKTT